MENMKRKIKSHIQNYYAKCRRIEAEYAEFETKEARNYYAPVLIQEKLTEKITKLKDARIELENLIDDEFLVFVDSIKPDTETINSIKYQTNLSNLFNLLNLDSELDESYFNFMVEANDFTTLGLLKDKYKSKVLAKVYSKVDKDKVVAEARIAIRLLKNYIDADKKYTMDESILNTLNQYGSNLV